MANRPKNQRGGCKIGVGWETRLLQMRGTCVKGGRVCTRNGELTEQTPVSPGPGVYPSDDWGRIVDPPAGVEFFGLSRSQAHQQTPAYTTSVSQYLLSTS